MICEIGTTTELGCTSGPISVIFEAPLVNSWRRDRQL
jgi:hypothetical protein